MNNLERLAILQNGTGAPCNFYHMRFEHGRERLAERWQMNVTREEWDELTLAVFTDAPTVTWVDHGKDTGSSLYLVEFRGQEMLVAFGEAAYALMTVFPRNDYRLQHVRTNSYIRRAVTSEDTKPRDMRRAIAADLDAMVVDEDGNLIRPRSDGSAVPAATPAAAFEPFKAALEDFVPSRRPLLTLAAKPVLARTSGEVEETFAKLNAYLDALVSAIQAEDADADEEVAELERHIDQIRSRSALSQMKRDFLSNSRSVAERAYDQFRSGVFDEASALSMARLLLAQQAMAAPPVSTSVAATGLLPITQATRGLEGIAEQGPDAVMVRDGRNIYWRLDGIQDSLKGWAQRAGISPQTIDNRIARGVSFRDALFGKKRPDAA